MYYLKDKTTGKYFAGGYTQMSVSNEYSWRFGGVKVPVMTEKPTAFHNKETAIRHYKTYFVEQFKSKCALIESLVDRTEAIYICNISEKFPDIEFFINDKVVPVDARLDRRTIFSYWLKVSGIYSHDISSVMMAMQAADIRGKRCNIFAKIAVTGIGDKPVFRNFCDDNRFRYRPAGAVPHYATTGWGVTSYDDLALMKLSLEDKEEVHYLDVDYDHFDFPYVSPSDILKIVPTELKYRCKKL